LGQKNLVASRKILPLAEIKIEKLCLRKPFDESLKIDFRGL
jgi:hypothetical protein